MTTAQLYDRLNDVDSSRENRLEHADLVLKDLDLIPKLIEIVFMVDDKLSCKAAWVLEFVCNQNLKALLPYLDTFTENLSKVYFDSAVRPVAKIFSYFPLPLTSAPTEVRGIKGRNFQET